jgi:hypothetical protein
LNHELKKVLIPFLEGYKGTKVGIKNNEALSSKLTTAFDKLNIQGRLIIRYKWIYLYRRHNTPIDLELYLASVNDEGVLTELTTNEMPVVFDPNTVHNELLKLETAIKNYNEQLKNIPNEFRGKFLTIYN